jgi:hypothetical protein
MRGPALALALIVAFPGRGRCAAPDPAEPPVVREIALEGITVFPPRTVYRAIVLEPGGRLRREPPIYAADLQRRYATRGYLGARVEASWDPEAARLTLRADEGRLRELELAGVEGGAEKQARTLLALAPGGVLTDKELRAGLRRLEGGSGGAFRLVGEPPYTVEPLAEGVRLRVTLSVAHVRIRLDPHGPDLSPLHTRVEGTAPAARVGITLFDPAALQHVRLYAAGSYGFTSHDPRFAFGVQKPFLGHAVLAGYEFHDLTDTDDFFRRFPVEAAAGIPRVFSITEDYYRRRGHEAYVFLRPFERFHLGLTWRHDRFETLPVLTDDAIYFVPRQPRPNPEIEDGTRDSFLVTLRAAAGAPLYGTPVAERESYLVRDPYGDRLLHGQTARLDATLELAGHTDEGGAAYRRLIVHARGHRDVGPRVTAVGRLLVGLGHDLPPQRLFALGGSGTLRGYSLKSFAGEQMAIGTAEARLHAWPRLDVIGFYDGGAAWTHGVDGAGWRDDVGLGLEWPGGGEGRLRVDGAYALRPPPGQDRARVYVSIVLPF